MTREGSSMAEMRQESNIIGPDLFGLYKHQIMDLLSKDDNFPPLSSTRISKDAIKPKVLFTNSLEDAVPLFKRDLFKLSLRQSVAALTHEVDEMIDPVMRIRHILACLNSKINKSSNGDAMTTKDIDSTSPPCKKQKTWPSDGKEYFLAERSRDAETETAEDDEDLKLLLGSEISVVEEIMNKQSDEHYATLNHMELQLEELLGVVASNCRLMTRQEKQQLRKLIQALPPRNLDRVVEIIHRGKSSDTLSLDEVVIDLDGQDNATLWRLYFYTRAVENAGKLSV